MTGTYRSYIDKKFNDGDVRLIATANSIIGEYEPQGYALTVRQLYYQMVARGFIENVPRMYDKIGNVVSDGRMAGVISWTAIEDRGRGLRRQNDFKNPSEALVWLRERHFRHDMWLDQEYRPEVWVEKQALEGVIEGICNELRVPFFATKGYNSQSEQWAAGRRFASYIQKGQRPIVFHLGDHDPSGIDMTRDNRERLSLFAGYPIQVARLALNWPQIEQFNPPPNPAKMTDSRAADYVDKYGDKSWELDALPPNVVHDLIRDAVGKLRDQKKWDAALAEEAEDLDTLDIIIEEQGDSDDGREEEDQE